MSLGVCRRQYLAVLGGRYIATWEYVRRRKSRRGSYTMEKEYFVLVIEEEDAGMVNKDPLFNCDLDMGTWHLV